MCRFGQGHSQVTSKLWGAKVHCSLPYIGGRCRISVQITAEVFSILYHLLRFWGLVKCYLEISATNSLLLIILIWAGVKLLNSRHYGDQYVLINVTIPQYVTQPSLNWWFFIVLITFHSWKEYWGWGLTRVVTGISRRDSDSLLKSLQEKSLQSLRELQPKAVDDARLFQDFFDGYRQSRCWIQMLCMALKLIIAASGPSFFRGVPLVSILRHDSFSFYMFIFCFVSCSFYIFIFLPFGVSTWLMIRREDENV